MKLILSFLIVLLPFNFFSSTENEENTVKNEEKSLINWMTFEEAWEASKKEPKKIMVDIYTDWCGPCKLMNQKTFKHKDIAKYINRNFYPVKLNAEMKEAVNIDGKEYTFVGQGRRGMHQLANMLMQDSQAYPTVTFIDEDREIIKAVPGYQHIVDMDKLLHYFAENHYKTTAYNIFDRTFRSRLAPKR